MAARSRPPAPNCGFQNVSRFGSFPTITFRIDGRAFTTLAENAAKSARAAGVVGVFLAKPCQTRTKSRMCDRRVASATFCRTCTCASDGRRSPGAQVAETIAALKPATREASTCDRAKARLFCSSASSTTPTISVRRLGLVGPGGGGRCTEPVSTGAVALGGMPSPVPAPVVGPDCGAVDDRVAPDAALVEP